LAVLPLPTAAASSQAVVIRDGHNEFCLTLDKDGEWFWSTFSNGVNGPGFSSSVMDVHSVKRGKGSFNDSHEVYRADDGVRNNHVVNAQVSGRFTYSGKGRRHSNGAVYYDGSWSLTLKDNSSGKTYQLRSGELLIIPIGCFDSGSF